MKGGNLAIWCEGVSFGVLKNQMPGFSFGLVSRLSKNRFRFLGFSFGFKFLLRKLFYLNTDDLGALLLNAFTLLQ